MSTKPDSTFAGLRLTRPNPLLAGEWVSIYDAEPAGLDGEGGRWQTVCETHSTICSHETLALAKTSLDPREFCEDCMLLDRLARLLAETQDRSPWSVVASVQSALAEFDRDR